MSDEAVSPQPCGERQTGTVRSGQMDDEKQRILRYWWMIELFSPQRVPTPTSRAARPADRQVVEWKQGEQLPWVALRPPPPIGRTRRVWQHTVYLGVYNLEETYERLHRAFGEDKDAYDERPAGRSACAGVLLDGQGVLSVDSAVLSSALWAVAQLDRRGVQDRAWADGFPEAAQAFHDAADKHEGERRESSGAESPLPQDSASLVALLRIGQETAGIVETPGLATDAIIIQSVAISAQLAQDASDIDFLNSFFLKDLATVGAELGEDGCGDALTAYLTSDDALKKHARVDVIQTCDATDRGVGVARLPMGRWPSDPSHSLALRQQFAVNQALNDLAPVAGLIGVNGPPGTGKTTMLRDLLAGNVVERARRLAALERPTDAFTPVTHCWTGSEGHPRRVRQLRAELTGFEMVVASANNAAVENVTTEIPVLDAIDSRWHGTADYFADIATAVLTETDTRNDEEPSEAVAWGMVAARLGNKRNRSAFQSAFWFDKKDPRTQEPVPGAAPRLQTTLAQWRDGVVPHARWSEARATFALAEKRVETILVARYQAQERKRLLPQVVESERTWTDTAARLQVDVRMARDLLAAARVSVERAGRECAMAAEVRDRCVQAKPGVVETVFSLGRVMREWRVALRPLDVHLNTAESAWYRAGDDARVLESRLEVLQRELLAAEAARQSAVVALAGLRRQLAVDEAGLAAGYPGESWTGAARELHAPWLDAELDTARSDLFLAALQLHQDFLANTAADMTHGLRAALEIVAGGGPHRLEPEKRRAAWQLFFLVVPLVSTTFASLGRMFGDIGPESIGWLLIDEAGQACPQYAAGGIWRAKRVVAVGDPLQLQPVVTIPKKVQRDIAASFGVSDTWIPPQASVQTLADRVSTHGTTLNQGERQVWVSAPLTVHRRCDDPMFTLCNSVAYNGIMVNGVKRRLDDPERPDLFDSMNGPLIAQSHWVDEGALTAGSHLQENQIARLQAALAYLARQGVAMEEVIAISPFRAVADRLESLSGTYPGLRAGTIHTAQGREASVVFLVLGGDPNSPGAKAWAASSVNLVNVAASRAKRRLFVIGDRTSWAEHNYFHQLATSLALSQAASAEGPKPPRVPEPLD